MDARNTAIGRKLPEGEFNVGFELTITCYPYIIFAQRFGGMNEMLIDKLLTHIEDGTMVGMLLHMMQPNEHFFEEDFTPSHLGNLGIRGFDIKHWWQDGKWQTDMLDKVTCLSQTGTEMREE